MRKFIEKFGNYGWSLILASVCGMLLVYYGGGSDLFVNSMAVIFAVGGLLITFKWSYELLDDCNKDEKRVD